MYSKGLGNTEGDETLRSKFTYLRNNTTFNKAITQPNKKTFYF